MIYLSTEKAGRENDGPNCTTPIVQSNFAPGAATWRTKGNNVVFDSGPLAPLYKKMTSSTKPEKNNVLHCRQRTEPWP